MIVNEVKLLALSRGLRLLQFLDDWLIRSQSQEEAQVNTQAVVDLTQSLGWIINRKKSELNLLRCFFIHGLRIPSRFSPCKTHSREMAQLQDLILRLKSKHVLTARCLMSLIGLLTSTEKMVPEGCLHMKPFSFTSKSTGDILTRLNNLLPWTETISAHLDWWQNPTNVMRGADLHPKTTASNSLQTPQTKVGALT